MVSLFARCALLVLPAVLISSSTAWSQEVDFNRDIRQILSDNCFACHGPDEKVRKGELSFDTEAGVFDRDPAVIVRGKPGESELIRRINSEDADEVMPPPSTRKTLTNQQKDLLKRWVAQGAKWANHWAYEQPVRHRPPGTPAGWTAVNDIDRFIQARLGPAGVTPSKTADRITLIRRLYFDLIGLPPTPEQVDAFLNDRSPQAYQRVVDSLLESPHFGERLAIYWLDVVRYADSNGYHSDEPRRIAPYRDYVIESFNSNKPYDRFVIEQLAGDLLPNAGVEQHVASGFNMLLQTTSEGGAQPKEYIAKYAADRVRNTSQIFLGSTMGCCECHNHKFDPFTQKDFYSLAAFFADIQQPAVGNPATFPVLREEDQKKLAAIDAQIAELQRTADTATPELAAAQKEWEAKTTSELTSAPEFGPWFLIGPFKAANFNEAHAKAFVDPARVDLAQPVGDLKWTEQKYEDGKPHAFDQTPNVARYLFRTVRVGSDSQLRLLLGSDDSLTVWVNGKKVHDNKVARGVTPDQDKLTVNLVEGENQILLKTAQAAGGAGFYFRADRNTLPDAIAAILKAKSEERKPEQQNELAKYYRSIAPLLQPVRDQIAKLGADKKRVNDTLPRTMMTKTGKPRVVKFLNRGDWLDESGAVMQPAVPEFLGSLDVEGRANRLDLAKWIVRKDNPLTARTLVNRLWKLYFGQGLATPLDDLGGQGTLPTHPQLLDWMAVEFMDSGWDIKHMVRLLVLSNTYRQSSIASTELKKLDPYNQFYARQSTFRLEAEIVRDNALAVSGLLVRDVGGRSVYPYQPAGYWRHMNFPVRKWPTDKGQSLYRRGLYTWWQRMFLHPSMLAFDAPSREECTVERPRSNIPQQALVLLNDPTYVEAARSFAERIVAEGGETTDQRVNWAYRQTLSRSPAPQERAVVKRVFERHLKKYQADADAAKAFLRVGAKPMSGNMNPAELAAWTSVARIILNLHETITRS